MLAPTLASSVPDSGLWGVECFRGVTGWRGLVAGVAEGRRCPSGAFAPLGKRGNSGKPARALTTRPGRLAYSNVYLSVTPTICAQ